MKRMGLMIASLCLTTTSYAQGDHTERGRKPMQTGNDSRIVAPVLEKYAQGPLAELWKRAGLTPRDRSIVTIAALIARNQTIEMPHYFNLALDNGVKPREISEIITHLAFYSGWANAMSAVAVVLSRQRSRVRVSSSPPFFLKGLGQFRCNQRRCKRVHFCTHFAPIFGDYSRFHVRGSHYLTPFTRLRWTSSQKRRPGRGPQLEPHVLPVR